MQHTTFARCLQGESVASVCLRAVARLDTQKNKNYTNDQKKKIEVTVNMQDTNK